MNINLTIHKMDHRQVMSDTMQAPMIWDEKRDFTLVAVF